MADPFANYDAWLEAPYTRAAKEQETFENYCATRNLDTDDEAWEAFLAEEDEGDTF